MPFNSQSYYRNKAKRQALEYLARARMGGEPERVAFNVKLARSSWRTYLCYRRLDECDADLKKRLRGEMSHAEFMNKWDIRNGP